MEKKKRFEKTYSQRNMLGSIEIWVDTETGVHYLCHSEGYGTGGFTPLLDREGKPVITSADQ